MRELRNCDGTQEGADPYRIFDDYFTNCPIYLWYEQNPAVEVTSFILSIEGGGMAVSRMLPSAMIEETAYYFNARSAIMSAKADAEKWRKKRRGRDKR